MRWCSPAPVRPGLGTVRQGHHHRAVDRSVRHQEPRPGRRPGRAVLAQARLLSGPGTGGGPVLQAARRCSRQGPPATTTCLSAGGAAGRAAGGASALGPAQGHERRLHAFTEHLDAMPDDTPHAGRPGRRRGRRRSRGRGAGRVHGAVAWLPRRAQERSHLVTLPMDDLDENAHLTNAIRHHATVLLQKSLVEGSGSPSPKRCGGPGR